MPSSLLQETCVALAEMRNVGFTIAVQTYTPKRFTCLLLCDESVRRGKSQKAGTWRGNRLSRAADLATGKN